MDKKKRYTRLDDYVYKVQEQFPEFSIEDLRYILKFGSNKLYKLIYSGADVLICSKITNFMFKILFGRITFQSIAHKVRYVLKKYALKIRIAFKRKNLKWDGYYYFGLTDEQYDYYKSQINPWFKDPIKIKKRYKNKTFDYGDVILYAFLEECLLNIKYTYIFRIKYYSFFTFKYYAKSFKTKYAECLYKRTLDGYENMLIDNDKVEYKKVNY